MGRMIQVEVESDEQERRVRRMLDFEREMRDLALTTPAERVFDACETAVVAERDRIAADMLERAVAARTEQAEKKGPRPDAAGTAASPARTAAGRAGRS